MKFTSQVELRILSHIDKWGITFRQQQSLRELVYYCVRRNYSRSDTGDGTEQRPMGSNPAAPHSFERPPRIFSYIVYYPNGNEHYVVGTGAVEKCFDSPQLTIYMNGDVRGVFRGYVGWTTSRAKGEKQ